MGIRIFDPRIFDSRIFDVWNRLFPRISADVQTAPQLEADVFIGEA